MKSRLLLGLGLCLSMFLSSCKDDDVNPVDLQVSIHSTSLTLVEGGEAVDVTVKIDKSLRDLKYLYLEGVSGIMDKGVPHSDGWLTAEVDGKQLNLVRVPIPSGERIRTVRLRVDEDEVYQGNGTFGIKVYSYENNKVVPQDSLTMNYKDITPKPVFGIFKIHGSDVAQTVNKNQLDRYFLRIMTDRSFTQPQKVTVTLSGTAEEGVHYEKEAQLVLNPVNYKSPWDVNSYPVLRIIKSGSFDPEKIIHIKLTAAEHGTIADGQEYKWPTTGDAFTLENTFTLTVKE